MIGRIQRAQGRTIFSLCDDNLLDKCFEDGEKMLDLTGDFFKGDPVRPETAKELMARADILFVVGKMSVEFAIDHNAVKKELVKIISNIPYAQIVKV